MVETSYDFGGVVFRFRSPRPLLTKEKYEAFRVPDDAAADFTFEISVKEAGTAPAVIWQRHGNTILAQISDDLLDNNTITAFLTACGGSALLVEKGRFILHASYVFHEGQAILFSAPSGTGKSTLAAHWAQARGSETVNEDRVIIREQDGVYYACGCWATGKAQLCRNVTAPIRAVVLLQQGTENNIRTQSALWKLQRLLPQCSFDEATQGARILDLASGLLAGVPVLSYACINDVSAVYELENHL